MKDTRHSILKQLELAEEHLDKAIKLEAEEWVGSKFRSNIRKAFTQIALAKTGLASKDGCDEKMD